MRWLLSQPNVEINKKSSNRDSVIFWAAKGRQSNTLQLLLDDSEVNKSLKDQFARTLLHVTLSWARPTLIEDMIKSNIVDLDAKDHTGTTCLHRAAHEAANKSMELIFDAYDAEGFDIDQVDAKGRMALHYGAMNNSYAVALLLWGNADQTLVDEDGLLPLDMAILWGNKKAIMTLDMSLSDPKRVLSHM